MSCNLDLADRVYETTHAKPSLAAPIRIDPKDDRLISLPVCPSDAADAIQATFAAGMSGGLAHILKMVG